MSILVAGLILTFSGFSLKNPVQQQTFQKMHHDSIQMQTMKRMMGQDNRISLHLPPHKAQHQLMNMRSHLKAVQSITSLIAQNKMDSASVIAHAQLGLTPEMKQMCTSFGNSEFESLGMGFHKSADVLSNVLKTGNIEKSLQALSNTLNYCVQCHAKFQQ